MVASPNSDVFHEAMTGDSGAWRALVGRYRPLLRLVAARHARRMVSNRYDESDVVQMTCVEALRGFHGFQGESREELEAWLENILEDNIVRMWRNHSASPRDFRREVDADEHTGGLSFVWNTRAGQDPARHLVRGEVAIMLAQALEKLPDEYRATLEMRFIDGRLMKEVAAELDTTVAVVAGRLRRGLKTLRELFPAELQELMEGGFE
ncbi:MULTISPECIES: RNA polymerase sigma factor [Pirellulaceae]|nr:MULTISPECIES: sigma-70 family RNA polymerase sigma factor [Pirellulaceae]